MGVRCEILGSSDMMQLQVFLGGVIGASQRYGLGWGGFIIKERRLGKAMANFFLDLLLELLCN